MFARVAQALKLASHIKSPSYNPKGGAKGFGNGKKKFTSLRYRGEDRMPSTVITPRITDGTEFWTSQKRHAAIENDEDRLLYKSRRSDDSGAVPITLPATRPMNKIQVPAGGPKPRNTLNNGLPTQRKPFQQTGKDTLRSNEQARLALQVSRGDNVPRTLHGEGFGEEDRVASPLKRRKLNHPASSPTSGTSTDELLDQHSPESITFGPDPHPSQAISIESINSQGSGFIVERRGSMHPLSEHRSVERMMDSGHPSNRQRRREANNSQQRNGGLPTAIRRTPSSDPVDVLGSDEDREAHSKPGLSLSEGSHLDPVNSSSSSTNPDKANGLRIAQPQSTAKTSPYFSRPASPTLPPVQSKHARNLPQASLKTLNGNSKLSRRLNDQFISVNGKRRSMDHTLSSDADELQLGTTVGSRPDEKALSSISRSRTKSPSKDSSSTLKASSPRRADAGIDPSDIKPSNFTKAEPKTRSHLLPSGPLREKKAPWAVDLASVNLASGLFSKGGMALVHDEPNKSYVIKSDGRSSTIQILPAKLQKIMWESSGRKMRFASSKTGSEDNIVDLELRKEKDVQVVVSRLSAQAGCKIQSVESERMEKMFMKRSSEIDQSITSAHSNPSKQAVTNSIKPQNMLQGLGHSRATHKEELKRERPKRPIVDELCGRASLEEVPRAKQQPTQSGEHSISSVLERLKPNHNSHLRRSTRISSEFKNPYLDIFDEDDDAPAVEKYSQTHGFGDPWKKPLIYPKVGRKKVTVEFSDLERLDEGEFLNDNLLSFYLRFLEHTLEEERPNLAKRVYFFNTFFYAALMNIHKGKKGFNYEGVQKWTRNVDLFTFDYIVVPINENAHWYLAIICNLPSLDRNLSIDSNELGLSSDRDHNEDGNELDRLESIPSSPAAGLLEQGQVRLGDDQKDLDERGTRNSFAEMSLDEAKVSTTTPTATLDQDQEMLDVPRQEPPSSTQKENMSDKAKSEVEVEELIDHTEPNRKEASKSKKGKRKSMPPAITKTSPDKPVIITFDSLGSARSSTVRILKDYLREEAKAKRGGMEFEAGQIKGITASQIPQQANFYDCGVFLLGYVAKFLEDDPKDFIAKIIRREYDETRDWPNLRTSILRDKIRNQILRLHQEQVADRQKSLTPRKGDQQAEKQDQDRKLSAVPVGSQVQSINQEPPNVKDKIEEKSTEALQSSQPAMRKEALETALGLEAMDPADDVKRFTKKVSPEPTLDHEAKRRESDLPSPDGPSAERLEKTKDSSVIEPSVILVESQSQQDGPAPKSFTESHPTPNILPEPKSPELPKEIQDSQPSQTSRTFADIVRRTSDKNDVEESQKIPVVPLINPRQAKKRKTGDENTITDTSISKRPADTDPNAPDWVDQFTGPSTRNKFRRKGQAQVKAPIQRSNEVINIDDD
ncbi:hypothetical protein ACLMJK_001290 [Lecanora helva]